MTHSPMSGVTTTGRSVRNTSRVSEIEDVWIPSVPELISIDRHSHELPRNG